MAINELKGLNEQEVIESREKHGNNLLTPPKKKSLWIRFLECFKDPLIRILLVALALSIGISVYEYLRGMSINVFFEPLGILIAILLATVIGFALEVNANKKFELLSQVNDAVPVKVIRQGNITQVPRADIVVGDIVILETGDGVPADGLLLDSMSLTMNESTLTGEPVIRKSHLEEEFNPEATYPTNHALRGSTVIEGHGLIRVERVGDATEYGKVYEAAQIDTGIKTPLSIQFDRLGKVISWGSYIIGLLIIIGRVIVFFSAPEIENDTLKTINYMLETVMIAITIIVVSVPEGLPMSVTLSLALSMRRMLASNNLVRKMHACETMGATTVICTDKTGTLTQNQMKIYRTDFFLLSQDQKLGEDPVSRIIEEGIAVNTTAFLEIQDQESGKVNALGNPTEGALLIWLYENGIDYMALRQSAPVVQQLPFSTQRKFMATVVDSPVTGKRMLYIKGAPEIVLGMCQEIEGGRKKEEIAKQLQEFQQKAMRTLGFAYAELPVDALPIEEDRIEIPGGTRFAGIAAISDPVRKEVPSAIRECIKAGISIKIVTGDTPGTAKEIGRQVGLWNEQDSEENHISGTDFAQLSDEEAAQRIKTMKIMSRARPIDKSRLVSLLQRNGEVVAVTGDGTNDAPALNAAQVGLSMGDGTAAAKEASDITIVDNSFASITKAVMWGRSLYQNIQRFILFQLTVNVVACVIVVIGAFTGTESPLTVTQMLWVNLIMDTFAALALASLPPSEEVMKRKPRRSTDFIINPHMKWAIAGVGLLFVVLLFGLLQYLRHCQVETLMDFDLAEFCSSFFNFEKGGKLDSYELTLFFTFFVFLQFWNLFNARAFESGHTPFHDCRDSKVFFSTLIVILLGHLLIVEAGGPMFNVVHLKLADWIIIIAATSIIMILPLLLTLLSRNLRNKD